MTGFTSAMLALDGSLRERSRQGRACEIHIQRPGWDDTFVFAKRLRLRRAKAQFQITQV